MKDVFDRLYKKGYSDLAIAGHAGISVEKLKEIKRTRPIIPAISEHKTILCRMKKILKRKSGIDY